MRRMMLAAVLSLVPVVAGAQPLILDIGGHPPATKSLVDHAPPCLSAWHEARNPSAYHYIPMLYSLRVTAPMREATALTADGKVLGVVRQGQTRQWICWKPATGVAR